MGCDAQKSSLAARESARAGKRRLSAPVPRSGLSQWWYEFRKRDFSRCMRFYSIFGTADTPIRSVMSVVALSRDMGSNVRICEHRLSAVPGLPIYPPPFRRDFAYGVEEAGTSGPRPSLAASSPSADTDMSGQETAPTGAGHAVRPIRSSAAPHAPVISQNVLRVK